MKTPKAAVGLVLLGTTVVQGSFLPSKSDAYLNSISNQQPIDPYHYDDHHHQYQHQQQQQHQHQYQLQKGASATAPPTTLTGYGPPSMPQPHQEETWYGKVASRLGVSPMVPIFLLPLITVAGLMMVHAPTTEVPVQSDGNEQEKILVQAQLQQHSQIRRRRQLDYAVNDIEPYDSEEDCVHRIVCEIGELAYGIRGTNFLVRLVAKWAPASLMPYVETFARSSTSTEGGGCHKIFCAFMPARNTELM